MKARIRFRIGVDVRMHQLTRAQADVIGHQHQLPQGGHETAQRPLQTEERRRIGALENGSVHVDVDGQSARVVKSLRHEQRTAHLDGVPEVGHVVQDAIGVDVVVR